MECKFSIFILFCCITIETIYCNSEINNQTSNYITYIDISDLSIKEQEYSYYICNRNFNNGLRNLAAPSWIVSNGCSQINNYSFSPSGMNVTRTNQVQVNETYVLVQPDPSTYFNYQELSFTIPKEIYWNVRPTVVADGGIFFGICVYDKTTCNTNSDPTVYTYFSGIAITYFATECYHIDHYYNNEYWTTPRHCLSTFELTNMIFKFKFAYDGNSGTNFAYLQIRYDGFEYYTRSQVFYIEIGIANPKPLNMAHPCTFMYSPNSQLQFMIANSTSF